MRKAIMLAVGDIPLELLCDLLEYNTIPASVIDGSELSVGELPKLIAEDNKSCFLVRNIDESYKQILTSLPGLADSVVFLFASPTITLSHAIKVSKGSIEPEHVVESWSANLSEIIDYVGKDKNYQLCDFSDVMSHPHAFLAELFDVDKAKNKDKIHDIENLLTDHIAELTLTENHEAFELYDEALAVSRLYGNFNAHLGISVDDLKLSALALGKTMFTEFASNELELKSKQDEVNTLLSENKDLTGKKALAEQLKRELDALEKNKQSGESKLNQELNEQKSRAEQMSVKLDALEQEKQSNESKLTKELTEHKITSRANVGQT
ncbi:hypothetical protein [Alteromonas sp. KUL49]|uniref:hypothetical protein n=1 Tax=Alteromonas sp. KUL49 TaxID=2480798 RepID=UPI00102F0AD9|nr:hypothetical protein [Alteromonas sp. KUL49]TAP37898.1 hypothetical protein EYS00_15480 [Alteromonas sp. KUL49]GEA12759.1 hypothetical protein KUL49_31340 [Alteromonas sp. KUL49]